ncbi:MAG: Gfo/Idh/MocA family oxidoreductase [Armatimonadetes bacterium]|nr:Gfo/Idh/MocA family oxidoreductase [Armatimonadota bacterium]
MANRDPSGSRSSFLKTFGLATFGAMAIEWKRSRAYSLAGSHRIVGANERIGVGVIGCGGQGITHIRTMQRLQKWGENIAVVAVCDVYQKRLDYAAKISDAKPYRDYRKLLEDSDVDAVFIVTPEHWHAKMTLDALDAGKDIYLEKPITRYLDESFAVYNAAMKSKSVIQVGSQWTSEERWWQAAELVKEGKLGKLVWSQTSYCRNSKGGEWN